MRPLSFEQRLLSVYKQAVRQNNWVVADHLLSAIEACAPPDVPMSNTVIEAYCNLAARVNTSARPTGLKPSG